MDLNLEVAMEIDIKTHVWPKISILQAGITLWMRPANERRRYIVTSSLLAGCAHTQNDPSFKWGSYIWDLIFVNNVPTDHQLVSCLWYIKKHCQVSVNANEDMMSLTTIVRTSLNLVALCYVIVLQCDDSVCCIRTHYYAIWFKTRLLNANYKQHPISHRLVQHFVTDSIYFYVVNLDFVYTYLYMY